MKKIYQVGTVLLIFMIGFGFAGIRDRHEDIKVSEETTQRHPTLERELGRINGSSVDNIRGVEKALIYIEDVFIYDINNGSNIIGVIPSGTITSIKLSD